MLVALVVECVIFVNTVFTVSVGVDDAAPAEQAANGVTALEAEEASEFPAAFVATTVKVYAVLFVKPVTFIGDVAPVAVMLPGLEVTV